MKYPYVNEFIDRYIELFKKEEINSIKEFVDNQKELCSDIIEDYDNFTKIPYTSFRYYFKKRGDYEKYTGEKVGTNNFNSTDYTKKVDKETDNEKETEKEDENSSSSDENENETANTSFTYEEESKDIF